MNKFLKDGIILIFSFLVFFILPKKIISADVCKTAGVGDACMPSATCISAGGTCLGTVPGCDVSPLCCCKLTLPPTWPRVTISAPDSVVRGKEFSVSLTYTHDAGEAGRIHLRWLDENFDLTDSAGCLDHIIKSPWEGIECNLSSGQTKTFKLKAINSGNFTLYYRAWDSSKDHPCPCIGEANYEITGPDVCSSEYSSLYPCSNASNGKTNDWWFSKNGDVPGWTYGDLGSKKCISGVKVFLYFADVPEIMDIQVSDDASSWNTVVSGWKVDVGDTWVEKTFSETSGRYVRLYITSSQRRADNTIFSEIREYQVLTRQSSEGNYDYNRDPSSGTCSENCDDPNADWAVCDSYSKNIKVFVPCTVSFNQDSYNLGDPIVINFNNAPPSSSLSLKDPSGAVKRHWIVSGTGNYSYTLTETDLTGTWLAELAGEDCSAFDTATVTSPSPPACSVSFNKSTYSTPADQAMFISYITNSSGSTFQLIDPTGLVARESSDGPFSAVLTYSLCNQLLGGFWTAPTGIWTAHVWTATCDASATATVIASCTRDSCDGFCSPNCTGFTGCDPDCGCQSGNACCGIGCTPANDSDCGVAPPPACGDEVIDPGEQCDPPNINSSQCSQNTSLCDYPNRKYGTRDAFGNCNASCQCIEDSWNWGAVDGNDYCTNCPSHCGDGARNCGEECEGADLGGKTCADFGFSGGVLKCKANCTIDTSGCSGGGEEGWLDCSKCWGGRGGGVPSGGPYLYNPLACETFAECIDGIISCIVCYSPIIAFLMIIIAGFLFITAGGDPERIRTAKRIIFWTVVGLFIVLFCKGIISLIRKIIEK